MRVYISGPMTGIPDYNRDAFMGAEKILLERGHSVVNPWTLGEVMGWGHFDYMRRDIVAMSECYGIYMLPGWLRSRGARAEWVVARLAFGMRRVRA
jgi:hypothetical protein